MDPVFTGVALKGRAVSAGTVLQMGLVSRHIAALDPVPVTTLAGRTGPGPLVVFHDKTGI